MQEVKNGGDDQVALLFVQGEDGNEALYSLPRAQVEELYIVAGKVLGK